jgi:hypothetical protein
MKSSCHTSQSVSRPGNDLTSGDKHKLCFLCALFIVTIVTAARAANSAPVTSPPVPLDHQFIKSTFGVVGKDPFFPRSTRITGSVPVTTPPDVAPAPVTAFTLKGISGPKTRRLAIINNKTVETGEETDFKVSSQTVRVKCVEIRDDGVTISVNGQIQKLLLKP